MPNEYPGADPAATLPDLSGLQPTLVA